MGAALEMPCNFRQFCNHSWLSALLSSPLAMIFGRQSRLALMHALFALLAVSGSCWQDVQVFRTEGLIPAVLGTVD